MRRRTWGPLLRQLFAVDLLICLAAYLLRPFGTHFTWLLIAGLLVLWWLVVAAVCNFLEVLVNGEER
jgi:hypothetical protein